MKKSVIFSGIILASFVNMGAWAGVHVGSQNVDVSVNVQDPAELSLSWTPASSPLTAGSQKSQFVGGLRVTAKGVDYITLHDNKASNEGFELKNGNSAFMVHAFLDGEVLTPSTGGVYKASFGDKSEAKALNISFKTDGNLSGLTPGMFKDTIIVDAYTS